MISAELGVTTLSATRLSVSPVIEVLEWLRLAATGRRHPRWGDTGAAARAALAHPDVRLLAGVLPTGDTGYIPDLLTPKPEVGCAERVLRAQLETVAATPADVARAQVAESLSTGASPPAAVRAAVDAGTFARRVAGGMWHFWRSALAGQWSALQSSLEAEISVRATTMARSGVGAVLGSLHPRIKWRDGRLEVHSSLDVTVRLPACELVLIPSVLAWPPVTTQFTDPAGAMLTYPAGNGGAAWRERTAAVDSMSELVGKSRAALLGDLGEPRSTEELSKRHGLAPATVSYHLGVLLRAGLVTRTRDRHRVYYRRKRQTETLLGDRDSDDLG